MSIKFKAEIDSVWVSLTYEKVSITARTIDFIVFNNSVLEKEKMKIKLSINMAKAKCGPDADKSPATMNELATMHAFFKTMASVSKKNSQVLFTVSDQFTETRDNQGHRFKLFKVSEIAVKRDTVEGSVTDCVLECDV